MPIKPKKQYNNLTLPPGESELSPAQSEQPVNLLGVFVKDGRLDYKPLPRELMTMREACRLKYTVKHRRAVAFVLQGVAGVMVLHERGVRAMQSPNLGLSGELAHRSTRIYLNHAAITLYPDEDTAVAAVITKHVKTNLF